jgi:hypothetical protein
MGIGRGVGLRTRDLRSLKVARNQITQALSPVGNSANKKALSLVGLRAFRVSGGDGGGSNYTCNTATEIRSGLSFNQLNYEGRSARGSTSRAAASLTKAATEIFCLPPSTALM